MIRFTKDGKVDRSNWVHPHGYQPLADALDLAVAALRMIGETPVARGFSLAVQNTATQALRQIGADHASD